MFPTRHLLQSCRITLFTRESCGLCAQAKQVLSTVWDKRPFLFREVDLTLPEARQWKNLYDFDIPVIHISRIDAGEEKYDQRDKALKLMHRFTPAEVEAKMDLAEKI